MKPALIKTVAESTICIKFMTSPPRPGCGTGFVDQNGYLITNFHVAMEPINRCYANNCQVQLIHAANLNNTLVIPYQTFHSSIPGGLPSQPTRIPRYQDHCIVDLRAHLGSWNMPGLILGNSQNTERGNDVVYLGYPFDWQEYSAADGMISVIRNNDEGGRVIYFNGPVNGGNSGGPLVLLEGEENPVIGIVGGNVCGVPVIARNTLMSHIPGTTQPALTEALDAIGTGVGWAIPIDTVATRIARAPGTKIGNQTC